MATTRRDGWYWVKDTFRGDHFVARWRDGFWWLIGLTEGATEADLFAEGCVPGDRIQEPDE